MINDRKNKKESGFDKLYDYNDFNQLERVRNSDGSFIAAYFYDHNGDRIKKLEAKSGENQTTYYVNKNFIRIVNSSGTFDEKFYYADNVLVASNKSGIVTYNHPDHLSGTSLVTDQNGNAIENSTYKPYGDTVDGGDSRYLFTGQEKDSESGLYYYGARYYNPSVLRRYTQPDNIIQDVYNPQDLNHYAYVRNNPYKYVDPTGNVVDPVTVTVVASAIYILGRTAFEGYKAYQANIALQERSGNAIDRGKAFEQGFKGAGKGLSISSSQVLVFAYAPFVGIGLISLETLSTVGSISESSLDITSDLLNNKEKNIEDLAKLKQDSNLLNQQITTRSTQPQNNARQSQTNKNTQKISSNYQNYYEYLRDLFIGLETSGSLEAKKGDDNDEKR